MLRYIRHSLLVAVAASAVVLAVVRSPIADACTRAVYFGKEGMAVTGRSMDWQEDMQSNLWVFPRGMKRDMVAWVTCRRNGLASTVAWSPPSMKPLRATA